MSTAVEAREKISILPDINKTERSSFPKEFSNPRSERSAKKMTDTEPLPGPQERSQTSTVSTEDIAKFRNSLKHNICVEMLRGGFHRSFSELFTLLQCWRESRLAAGPGSALWLQQALEDQPHKLHTLHTYLTLGEAALRRGAWAEVYDSQVTLARFFGAPEDVWLSRHFYQASLRSSQRLRVDGGRKLAEANGHMGRVYMEQGQLDLSREHYECFYHQTAGRRWAGPDGVSLHSLACQGLCSVYTQLAQRPLLAGEYRAAIHSLSKAFDMAREAGDKRIEGEAAYQVGLAYQHVGDQQTAKKFFNMYMEISSALGDADGLGKAYRASAKSLESEGKLAETVQYLEKFAEVSQNNDQPRNLEEACMCLGHLYTSRGQYEQGCVYLERAYQLTSDLGEVPLLQWAQVVLGSARAHSMIRKYSLRVEAGLPSDLLYLTSWKDRPLPADPAPRAANTQGR